MSEEEPRRLPVDRTLLLEVVLVLVLIGLAVRLYLMPMARGDHYPAWWAVLLLGALFFGVLALDGRRRKVRGRRALRDTLEREQERERE